MIAIFHLSFSTLSHAERDLITVYQPTSLLGTEKAEPTIVSRPVIVGGAYPEGPVNAISLPHRIAGAPEGFPDESNLIILSKAQIHAEWGEKEHQIIADFSNAIAPRGQDITVLQIMRMTAICLQKTLGAKHTTPIKITWLAPKGIQLVDAQLPKQIKMENKAQ